LTFSINPPRLLSAESALASAFFAAGCYCLSVGSWLPGAFLIVLALIRGLLYKGIEIDVARQRFRFYLAVFPFRLGSWQALPTVDGVALRHFSSLVSSGRAGRMRADKDNYTVVMLSVQGSDTGLILERFPLRAQAKAAAFAQEVASYLQVPVRSYSAEG
jgi:hypothetical protein